MGKVIQFSYNSNYSCRSRWHGDIKPENILACGNLWKITDPGFAMLKHHTEVKRDENGLPVVELRGGTETYGQPTYQSYYIGDY